MFTYAHLRRHGRDCPRGLIVSGFDRRKGKWLICSSNWCLPRHRPHRLSPGSLKWSATELKRTSSTALLVHLDRRGLTACKPCSRNRGESHIGDRYRLSCSAALSSPCPLSTWLCFMRSRCQGQRVAHHKIASEQR